MADVFISYARADEPHAERVAGALREAGYGVWRDDELPAHRAYAEVIEERLKSAKAVVVLWSAEAARSQWVRAEADSARAGGTLVQASLDGTIPPLPFNQIQCADLKDWGGDASASGWRKIAASVAALTGETKRSADAHPRQAGSRQLSVCVLPFANMSGDPEQDYFSDGISEDITTDLSKVSALEVIARNTAFQFKGQSIDVCAIAGQLGVSHVLEGSVRKAGNRVRINAQLVDSRSGGHIWAERYDRDLTDIFAIQDEITKEIVAALKLKLLPEEKTAIEKRGTDNAEAYNLYLMARQYWLTCNHGDVRRDERVVRICQRAVQLDPDYARAWALLALSQATLKFGYGREGDGGLAAAERALALDPHIAEAHCVLARHHSEAGRDEEADAEIAHALRLDFDSWEVNKEAARLHMLRREIPEAKRHYEKAVEVMENDYHAWAILITCYEALGDRDGVVRAANMMVAQAEKAISEDPSNVAALGVGAGGLAALGQTDRAREWIDRAMLMDPDNLSMRYNFGCIVAEHLKDPEAAMDILELTFEKEPAPVMIRLADTDPDLDSLRCHPRFQKMMDAAKRRLGIEVEERANPPEAEAPPRS